MGGQLIVSAETIITVLANIVIMIALTLFTSKTKMGKSMRGVSEDKGAAQLMGINVNLTISVTFAIGSALAAFAGFFMVLKTFNVEPSMGAMPGIKAFTAAVIGGIGSIPGAMLGGILMGVVEAFAQTSSVMAPYTDAIEFSILIVILLVRPSGILGKKRREKV
jgi:branched-chain amino acid transport system permease protein